MIAKLAMRSSVSIHAGYGRVTYAVLDVCASKESRTSLNFRLGIAPTRRSTGWPFLKIKIVGMLITWYLPAISGFSSVLSFITLTLPAYSVANSSMTGATIWQGPHQTAQKSTKTTCADFITWASQLV